jgi:hypothetical protein
MPPQRFACSVCPTRNVEESPVTEPAQGAAPHPVDVQVAPTLTHRNRLTTLVRPILAIPHIILVGTPAALTVSLGWHSQSASGSRAEVGSSGILGLVAMFVAIIAWFAIVITGEYPVGLRDFATYYLRWRVRASAYLTLLRDEYPPFGDAPYSAELVFTQPAGSRDRLTVAFRIILAIPQILAVWCLGIAWALTTLIAWVSILITGNFPPQLYHFGVGALRWSTRVEAYLLLLHDEYPSFSLESDKAELPA